MFIHDKKKKKSAFIYSNALFDRIADAEAAEALDGCCRPQVVPLPAEVMFCSLNYVTVFVPKHSGSETSQICSFTFFRWGRTVNSKFSQFNHRTRGESSSSSFFRQIFKRYMPLFHSAPRLTLNVASR